MSDKPAKIEIVRTDGTREKHELSRTGLCEAINRLIGADTFDALNIRDAQGKPTGFVLIVDDYGWECETIDHGNGHIEMKPIRALKPVNEEATKLYHAQCVPGTTHQIVGDVAIAWDEDFA